MDYNFSRTTTINSAHENARNVLAVMGRAGLHALAPEEFEYYLCSFELLDSAGNTIAFMNFPVMPNSIVESESKIMDIVKTNKGIVTMFNSSFVPKNISLQGTFGRKFRLLTGVKDILDESKKLSNFLNGNIGFGSDPKIVVKTGFGMTNLLRKIIKKVTEVDETGMPYVLLFTNYASNVSYVVEINQHSISQSIENNALWFYNLEMTAVAPSSVVKVKRVSQFRFSIFSNAIAQGIQNILSDSVRSLMQF